MSSAEARRLARRHWTVGKYELGEESENADARFWLSIPVDQRALAVWDVSIEAWSLVDRDAANEPGLCRSVASVDRREG